MGRRTWFVAGLTALSLVTVAVFAAVAIQGSYSATLSSELSKLSATARVAGDLVSAEMRSVQDVEQLTLERENFIAAVGPRPTANLDVAGLQTVLEQVASLRPEFQFATVADARGIIRATAPTNMPLVGEDLSFRDWFQGAIRTGERYVSRAYAAAVPGTPLVVAVSTPIRGGNPSRLAAGGVDRRPILGVLAIGYKISSIQTFTDGIGSLEQVHLHVTDQSGVTVVREGGIVGQLVNESSLPEVSAPLLGRSTAISDAVEIAAGVPVPQTGWTVSADVPIGQTAASAQRQLMTLIGAGILLVIALAGGALVVATRRAERADKRHAAGEAQLDTVQRTLADTVMVYDRMGELVSANPAATQLFGLPVEQLAGDEFNAAWEQLREDGTPLGDGEGPIATAVRTGRSSNKVLVGLRGRADQEVRWLSLSTAPIRDAVGSLTGYVSTARDVTERIDTIRELRILSEASQRLAASLNPLEVVPALTAAASEICSSPGEPPRRAQVFMIDGASMTLTGQHDVLGAPNLDGQSFAVAEHPYVECVIATNEALVAEFDVSRMGPRIAASIRDAEIRNCAWLPMSDRGTVFAVLAVSGRQHKMVSGAQLDRLKTLAALGKLAVLNARAHQQMAVQALTDPLTGLPNRRALDERLAQLPRMKFAILALDIDDLKPVNDSHGHASGDELITAVGHTVVAQLRPSDLLARTGGDEFIALLIDCDGAGAAELTKRLHRAVAGISLPFGTPSVSIGSAAGAPDQNPELVIGLADTALYAAKAARKAGPPAAVRQPAEAGRPGRSAR